MKENNFDRKKVIEDMKKLKSKIVADIKARMLANGETKIDEENLAESVTIKYLGKIGLVNEQGELIESDWYAAIEQIGGELQIVYYDEQQNVLGRQLGIDGEVIPSEGALIENEKGYQKPKEMENLKEEVEQAKTLEQLEQEQMQTERQKQHLQLTQKQVNSLTGPKINLNDFVDNNVTLSKKMGIQGEHIQFVDIDKLKAMDIPGFKAPAELGQRFMPIAISSNGTATVVEEDKLKFSTLEGGNASIERDSMNSDGAEKQEQGIVTFNIPGTNNAITIHWDDELGTSSPFYEASFLTRAPDNKGHLDELTNEGHLKKDNKAHMECIWNTEGEYEGIIEVDRLTVTEELAKKYAEIRDYQKYDAEGNPTLDIGKARAELEQKAEVMKESTRGSDREEKPSIYGFVKQAQREKEERNADAKELGPSDMRRPY